MVETPRLDIARGRATGEKLAAMPSRKRPTAVFCANDLLALGLLQDTLRRGLSVPGDLAIVGYDDIDFAAAAALPLTSVRQPRYQLGKAAMEMLLVGDLIDAPTAARYGLVNHAVPESELDATVRTLATRIAAKSPAILALGKPAFYAQAELPLAAAYDNATAVMVRNMAEPDAAEGIDAFLEKRSPVWA